MAALSRLLQTSRNLALQQQAFTIQTTNISKHLLPIRAPLMGKFAFISSSSNPQHKTNQQGPLLLLPYGTRPINQAASSGRPSKEKKEEYYCCYSLQDKKLIWEKKKTIFPWQKELLLPDDACWLGSSHGWLVFYHPRTGELCITDPFSSLPSPQIIRLPPLESLPYCAGSLVYKSEKRSPSASLIKLLMQSKTQTDQFPQSPKGFLESAFSFDKFAFSSPPSVLSSNSASVSSESCFIMWQKWGENYFCRLGDSIWTALESHYKDYGDEAIVYFKKERKFYELIEQNFLGSIECRAQQHKVVIRAWDLHNQPAPKFTDIEASLEQIKRERKGGFSGCDLVESCDGNDLLLTVRYRFAVVPEYDHDNQAFIPLQCTKDMMPYQTCRFEVYRLNFDEKKWETVKCLGNQALFLGPNDPFALSTIDFPYLRKNSIYFADHDYKSRLSNYKCEDRPGMRFANGAKDMGIFSLKDESIDIFHVGNWKKNFPAPIWIAPNP